MILMSKIKNSRHKMQGTRKKKFLNFRVFLLIPCSLFLVPCFLFLVPSFTGCKIYSFKDISIPDSIKTVKINFIENRAQYTNPQLSQRLTDRLRQKIVNQTRLNQTNNDDAHYDISGFVSNYSVSTSGISNQQSVTNRLTVGVHIILNDRLNNKVQEYDISRPFDFSATLSLQQAETRLNDEIIQNITDEIFNRIFSNW